MNDRTDTSRGWTVALWLSLGYVAVYLCRKNLSVAVPLLQETFHVNKAAVGSIASIGTVGYMLGKFASGPIVDRIGGRAGFLLALAGVGLFGALSALSPGLAVLAALYAVNRFSGAWGWNSMVKLIASWFPPRRLATAIAVMSLSYIAGGIAAPLFAQQVIAFGGGWRAVIGIPSLALLVVFPFCAAFVRPGPIREIPADEDPIVAQSPRRSLGPDLLRLLARPQFQTLCILSFTLTLVRDAFGTWSVDYLASLQSGANAVGTAALQSAWFDAAGAIPILLMGLAYDRLSPQARRWTVIGILVLLSVALASLRTMTQGNAVAATVLMAAVGLLLYGPYSILAGVVSIESGGTDLAGTATGFVDGIGYLAAILSGYVLGSIIDKWGYPVAFTLLAALTLLSAVAALRLRGVPPVEVGAPEEVGEVVG